VNYYDLGKIVFSNNISYIGQHLRVSEPNYIMINTLMDMVIKPKDLNFEKARGEFIYQLKEEVEEYQALDWRQKPVLSNHIRPIYTVYIFYDMYTKWDFELYYAGSEPDTMPIELYINDIINAEYLKRRVIP